MFIDLTEEKLERQTDEVNFTYYQTHSLKQTLQNAVLFFQCKLLHDSVLLYVNHIFDIQQTMCSTSISHARCGVGLH